MITINDVAKEAGVSITTVSRVLNNNYPVKLETRIKVENAIKKLNFRPNQMARSLIIKKTSVIGVVVPGITNWFFQNVVENIEKQVKKSGYSIMLCNTRGDYKEEKKLVDKLFEKQVDGIIAIDPSLENLKSYFYAKISEDIPLIIVKSLSKDYNYNVVSYDEEVGLRQAFSHFFQKNHKKIAFIRGMKSISYDVREKIYKTILKEMKLGYKKIIKVSESNSSNVINSMENILLPILKGKDAPTAIFACNDLIGVGVLNCCRKLKINIPKELSLISCDNTLITDITYPRLSSIDLGIEQIGKVAAKEILDLIKNGTLIRKKVILNTKLILRDSSAT